MGSNHKSLEVVDIVFWCTGAWVPSEELDEQLTYNLGDNYLSLSIPLPTNDELIGEEVRNIISYKAEWDRAVNSGKQWEQKGRLAELGNRISLPTKIKEAIQTGWG